MITITLINAAETLLVTGADPAKTAVFQSREMIKGLHARLDAYDVAIAAALEQLGNLPEIFRAEVEYAFDRDQRRHVHTAIGEIFYDLSVLAKKGGKPDVTISDRLKALGEARGKLFLHGNDLYQIPTLMEAMRVEIALRTARADTEENRQAHIQTMKTRYRDRLERALDPERQGSLAHAVEVATEEVTILETSRLKMTLDRFDSFDFWADNPEIIHIYKTIPRNKLNADDNFFCAPPITASRAQRLAEAAKRGEDIKEALEDIIPDARRTIPTSESEWVDIDVKWIALNYALYMVAYVEHVLATTLREDDDDE